MCEPCYRGLIADRRNSHCFICSGPLPNYKLDAQMRNSREIREHIHDGQCLDYHTLIHCKVIGEDMSFLKEAMNTQLIEYSPQASSQMSDLQALQENLRQQIELVKSLVFEKAPIDMNQGNERVQLKKGRSISSNEDQKVTVIPYPKSGR